MLALPSFPQGLADMDITVLIYQCSSRQQGGLVRKEVVLKYCF
jgi:hypothetical protein